jgi:hypothetical protein
MARLAATDEPSEDDLVQAKALALRAQLAAMQSDLGRLERGRNERDARRETERGRRAWKMARGLLAEHRAEEQRQVEMEKRRRHDMLNGTPARGPGYSHYPDGQRLHLRQITLSPETAPQCAAPSGAPSVSALFIPRDLDDEPGASVMVFGEGAPRVITE